MSLATRISLLMLGACLVPLSAHADPATLRLTSVEDAGQTDDETDALLRLGSDDAFVASSVGRTPLQASALTPAAKTLPVTSSAAVKNSTGAGVMVGVVDTGIQLSHPEFAGRIATGSKCFGTTTACSGLSAKGNDNNGHGTHVAGIIGAANNGVGTTGVAPGATLLAVKVLDASGSGTTASVGQGIGYAAQQGAKVINLSLGGGSPSSLLLTPLQAAARTAVIVAAAGNGGNRLAPSYPAAYATQSGVAGTMLIVGSVNGARQISKFSQTPGTGGCATVSGVTRCFRDVFVVAPGEAILSTYPTSRYATMSGTSMATPYVSGVAARVIAAAPYLTNRQVVDIILRSAIDLGARGTDAVYGRGLVSLTGALAPVGAQTIATSGATTGEIGGTGEVSGSALSGPLSGVLRGSSIIRGATFFDEFGRDYTTDLTHAFAPATVSLVDMISRPNWSQQFISHTGQGYSVAGFVADGTENAVASLGFQPTEGPEITDMVVVAQLSDSTRISFGHDASLQGRVSRLDLAADDRHDGLFMSASALNSPFLALADGGDFGTAAVRLAEGVSVAFGYAHEAPDETAATYTGLIADDRILEQLTKTVEHQHAATSTLAVVTWEPAPWASVGVSVGMTDETNGLLGSNESGALAMTADASTTFFGSAFRFNLGARWALTGSWSFGRTQATPEAGGLVTTYSELESQAYGLALARRDLLVDGDSFGIAISRPLHVTSGTAMLRASTGVTEGRDILYTEELLALASGTPETDYEIGYTRMLSLDTAVQANFIYQQNAGGQAGVDGIAGLVTLRTRW